MVFRAGHENAVMIALRVVGAVVLLVAAVMVATVNNEALLLIAIIGGFVLRTIVSRSARRAMRSTLPVVVFAALLALMQWASSQSVSSLPPQTIALFLFSATAFGIFPWSETFSGVRPGSTLFGFVLFALFIRHFAIIFTSESRRVLQARSLGISRAYGPGWFRSLVAAVAALIGRSLSRAERFYAAQSLRGFTE
jgi:energy-coupling factor transporter transmembrane protein EcfT